MNQSERAYKKALNSIKNKKMIPLLRVIRLKCLDCCCWQIAEVKLCPSDDCILWDFRMGKKPVKRAMSEKQKANIMKLRQRH